MEEIKQTEDSSRRDINMRLIVTVVLTAILVTDQIRAQQPEPDSPIRQEIASLPTKALVEVSMREGGVLRGQIVNRADADFTLRKEKGGAVQTIAYDQVRSVSQIKNGHSYKKWIII